MKTAFVPSSQNRTPSSASRPTTGPSPAAKKASTSWLVTGILLILAGVIMLPTMVLTGIGAVLILGGIAVITSAYLRTSR